ncbi:MAG: M48 family metallopeptidase [bacterium]
MKYIPKELKGNVNISPKSPLKEFFYLLVSLLGILLGIYIILGFMIDLIVPRLSPDVEKRLGTFFSQLYESNDEIGTKKELQRILDDLTKELSSEKGPYKIHLVPDPQVNALALPGNNIIIFTALLKEIESENELAFVFAHEIGHFANRDHLRGFGRMLVLFAISASVLGQDSSITDFLHHSLVNTEMQFSQRQEKMADLYALDLLNRRYGHVAGALEFLEKMAAKETRSRLSYIFASHPYPPERIETLKQSIEENKYSVKETIPLKDSITKSATCTP